LFKNKSINDNLYKSVTGAHLKQEMVDERLPG